MIISTKELLIKYKKYKCPYMKIKKDVTEGKLINVIKGVYEDNKNTSGYLLINYIVSPSYLSFEYVLAKYGLIPERVINYTCATTMKKHNKEFTNYFGNYTFTDIPVKAFMYGVEVKIENDYSYAIASPEKALCDLLYKKPTVISMKGLKELLFENLRIDEEMFWQLDLIMILELCDKYISKNLKFLSKIIKRRIENE